MTPDEMRKLVEENQDTWVRTNQVNVSHQWLMVAELCERLDQIAAALRARADR